MSQTILLCFVAGVFAGNGTPHFVKGIAHERFPTVFGDGPLINLVAGWVMYVLAAVLAMAAQPGSHPIPALAAAAAGVLVIGVFHALGRTFGRRPTADVT